MAAARGERETFPTTPRKAKQAAFPPISSFTFTTSITPSQVYHHEHPFGIPFTARRHATYRDDAVARHVSPASSPSRRRLPPSNAHLSPRPYRHDYD